MNPAPRPKQMRSGRFTILRPLSKGGMGALYLANEAIATGNRKVVIKEMLDYYDPSDPKGQAKAQRRFESEAITLANLSIPGIPQVFDYFTDNGRNYIVMQFIEGQNLESGISHLDESGNPIKGKPYPAEKVRRWGIALCKVLESLTSQNVIHMDIKPANLILDKAGTVWLVDFGTARAPRSGLPGASLPGAGGLKKSSIFGTIGYAAPEQAAGNPDPRSDVFALAATLYHLATDDDPGLHPGKFPLLDHLPSDIVGALRGALTLDVRRRITASEFSKALEPRSTRAIGFHWQDGTITQDPADLAVAADTRWEEASSYFIGSAWENWLQDIYRHDLATRLTQIKSQIKDVDLGLDNFLRLLNPGMPAPVLRVPLATLDLGLLPWRSQRMLDIEVQNNGAGALSVRCPNLPKGFKITPDLVGVHRRQSLKLSIDASQLSPSPKPQMVPLTIDAGSAGRARLRLQFTIPPPALQISPASLDLGTVYRGQAAAGSLSIRNIGSSPFRCELTCFFPDSGLDPAQFDCLPGSEQVVSICIATQHYSLGTHNGAVRARMQAGNWEQVQSVPTTLTVSIFSTLWKTAGPPFAWAAVCGIYGGFLGWFMATMVGGINGQVVSPAIGGLAGALMGVIICVLPAMAIGGLGWLREPPGKTGLRFGAILGGLCGTIAGGLTGILAGWIAVSVLWFGVLVGGCSAATLGLFLQRRLKL